MSNTLSFVVLDDLCVHAGPYHTKFYELTPEIVKVLYQQYLDTDNDPTYFFEKDCKCVHCFSRCKNICDTLKNDGYYVQNRVQKYYVIAFAINYARFSVWSKDCESKIIDWKAMNINQTDDIENGEIMDNDPPDDYRVSPVIKLMRQLGQIN